MNILGSIENNKFSQEGQINMLEWQQKDYHHS